MNENEKFYEDDLTFRDLFSLYERIFRSQNYTLLDSFDNSVWFLKDDPEFYKSKIGQTTPNTTINPEHFSMMHQILEQTSTNGNDFKKLKVHVSTFIRILVIELLKIQKQKLKITQKINSFNIDESVNVIEEKIEKLKDEASYTKSDSFLKISLVKCENIPEGEYEFRLNIKKSKKNNLVDKGIIDNEEAMIALNNTVKVSGKVNEFKDSKETTFDKIKIYPVDINYSEFKPDEEILKIFSGTNLNSFQIECKNKTKSLNYKSKDEEILELYLKLIDFFCDLTKVTHDCILTLFINQENQKGNINYTASDMKLSINLNFVIDSSVRRNILLRIHYIFKLSISYRTMVENNLNTLLRYFGTHGENIKIILVKENVEHRSDCCGGKCLIF